MISGATLTAFIIAALLTLPLPILFLAVSGTKKRIRVRPLFIGVSAFFVSQIVVRIPLLGLLAQQSGYADFVAAYYIPSVFLLAFSAGLFEESARLGGALFLKENRGYIDVISFGLGHAFCEVIILIGLTHVNNILICLVINDTSGTYANLFPAETFEVMKTQMLAVRPADVYLGLVERFSAVLFHIFATVLVFRGVVTEKKLPYYALAVGTHTLFNMTAVLLARYVNVLTAETVLLVMALAAGYYVKRAKNLFDAPPTPKAALF